MMNISQEMKDIITITPFNICAAFKDIKRDKSCGVDGISGEYFTLITLITNYTEGM